MYILFIHLSDDGHLGCFYSLAIIINVAMHIYVQDFVFNSFDYIKKRTVAGSYANSIFNCLKNC